MKILKNEIKNNSVKYLVGVDKATWKNAQMETLKAMTSKIKVPGFRPGKVPYEIAKKHVGPFDVMQKSVNGMVNKTYQQLLEAKEVDKSTIIEDAPQIDIVKFTPDELEIAFVFEAFPKTKLADYKNIKIDYHKPSVSDQELKNEISRLLKRDSMIVDKKNKVDLLEKGDVAVMDFKGSVDNKEFTGGSSENYELEIGSNQFIPGFEDQMIGMKKNQTKTINVKFPDNYNNADLKGKDAKFVVTVKDIKTLQWPEVDAEYCKKFKIPSVKNLDDLKVFLKKQLLEQKDLSAKDACIKSISEYIMKNSSISYVPKSLLKGETDRLVAETKKELEKQNLTIQKMLDYRKITQADFDKETEKTAIKNLTLVLALEKIIAELKLKVSPAEIDEHLKKMAQLYNTTEELVKKQLNNNYEGVETFILQKKLFDTIIDLNTNKPSNVEAPSKNKK